MKKLLVLFLGLILIFSLTACGRRNDAQTSTPTTTAPMTTPSKDNTMLPTIETNIPDPSVDTSMPMYTEDSNATTGTDHMTGNDAAGGMNNGAGTK